MREKYVLRRPESDAVMGLRWDPKHGEVMLAGPVRFREDMENVWRRFVKVEVVWGNGKGGRLRSVAKVDLAAWELAVEALQLVYTMEHVVSFRRLTR